MKVSKNSFNIMATVGGIAGGMAAKFVGKLVNQDGESNYLEIGVEAVAGAALSALVSNDIAKGAGAAMVGVAGYQLANQLGIGEEEATTETKTSGLGLLPSQSAVSALPFSYRRAARVRGVEEEEKEIRTNVQ